MGATTVRPAAAAKAVSATAIPVAAPSGGGDGLAIALGLIAAIGSIASSVILLGVK
ncbi:MAG: hypothetical protein IT577_16600 [Verrucomicrobiae bacterium]|nr:hypothetical protein [Verrucomicrobiae bacterium]